MLSRSMPVALLCAIIFLLAGAEFTTPASAEEHTANGTATATPASTSSIDTDDVESSDSPTPAPPSNMTEDADIFAKIFSTVLEVEAEEEAAAEADEDVAEEGEESDDDEASMSAVDILFDVGVPRDALLKVAKAAKTVKEEAKGWAMFLCIIDESTKVKIYKSSTWYKGLKFKCAEKVEKCEYGTDACTDTYSTEEAETTPPSIFPPAFAACVDAGNSIRCCRWQRRCMRMTDSSETVEDAMEECDMELCPH